MFALYFKIVVKNATLSPKKLYLGFDTIPCLAMSSIGINMSLKRIESTVKFSQPKSSTELYSFLGLINYFRDHIPRHSNHFLGLVLNIVIN